MSGRSLDQRSGRAVHATSERALPSLELVFSSVEESGRAHQLAELEAFFEARGIAPDGAADVGRRLGAAREELEIAVSEAGRLAAHVSLAGPLLATLAVETDWTTESAVEVVDAIARHSAVPASEVGLALFRAAAAAPILTEIPPPLAAAALLRLFASLAPVSAVSLWRGERRLRCETRIPATEPSRRERAAAVALLRGEASDQGGRALVVGLPVVHWDEVVAAVVARARGEAQLVRVFLQVAADALAPVLSREVLLERNAERERALVNVAERRLVRLGFDLHDGPIQDVIALAADLRLARRQADETIKSRAARPLVGRFDDLEARLVEIEGGLRQLSHALEPPSMVRSDLEHALERELAGFERRHGIRGRFELVGELGTLTDSQHIVLYRLVQEALSNVREHAAADGVDVRLVAFSERIEVSIVDDGRGFDVEAALLRAGREGRLGLIGMSERVRLLGGRFRIDSAPGCPTAVTAVLPRWQPTDG